MSSWDPDADVLLTDSDDEENENIKDYSKGREAVLFVIDAAMTKNNNCFYDAMDIVRKAFISALLVKDKDLMGVMFANTEHSPAPIEANCLENILVPSDCAVLLPLRQLSKAIVDYLLKFIQSAEDTFGELYGCGHAKFANMIRLCCNLFENCGYQRNNATIVYMTADPLPHEPFTPDYTRALLKAKDLGEHELEFHVIPMVDEFNYDLFYKEFLTVTRDVDLDSFEAPDAHQLREILADRKLKQNLAGRTLGNFNFSLGPGLDIAVQYFNYFKTRCYPRKVVIMRKDNSIVRKKRVTVAYKEDPVTTECSQVRRVDVRGGWYEINVGTASAIRISAEQINRVRNFHEPGMLLLGFKTAAALPDNLYCKPCNFMYPADKNIPGSGRLFRALWQRCYERQKIAICLFLSRRKTMPRYVALVPVIARTGDEEEDSFEYKALLSGDGFKIVYLPMEKHIRHIDFMEWNSLENAADKDGVEFFENISKKLRMRYQPNLINDPVLQLLQSQLLALALNIQSENNNQTEMPNVEAQDERIRFLLPQCSQLFGEDIKAAVKKRPAITTTGASSAPKIKITEQDVVSYDFVMKLVEKDTLQFCTVMQLRSILDKHFNVKPPASSKKVDLIERIRELST